MRRVRLTSLIALLVHFATTANGANWEALPHIGTGYSGAKMGEITSDWVDHGTGLGQQRKLKATRASGDKDRKDCQPVADQLKGTWPRWKCVGGSFLNNIDKGTEVTWVAPSEEATCYISLWEDDVPLPKGPGDSGTRDDTFQTDYGQLQDSVTVKVAPVSAVLTVRNSLDTVTLQTQALLHLWFGENPNPWAEPPPYDWRPWCENGTGDRNNGPAVYRPPHQFALGSNLKTEIFALIVNDGGLPEAAQKENWRICQELKSKTVYTPHTPQGPGTPEVTEEDWTGDGAEGYDGFLSNFDMPNRRLCTADPPGYPAPDSRPDGTPSQPGDVEQNEMELRTWVEFNRNGQWIACSDVVNWGLTVVFTRGQTEWEASPAEAKPIWRE